MDFASQRGFSAIFGRRLTLGLLFPIEAYPGDVPRMTGQEELARRAEALGFSALWVRDVPLRDPSFGDVGQIYDPWVYLAHIAAHTRQIALGTAAIVLPLRHPLHVAKAAASLDALTGGRFVLGVASGDRPREFAAFALAAETRGERFRDHLAVVRRAFASATLDGLHPIPKPLLGDLPVLVTGQSQQDLAWIAQHAEAWITYPRPLAQQALTAARWREAVEMSGLDKAPWLAQSLYIDLDAHPHAAPRPIHLGWSLGREPLVELLASLHGVGVHHVVLNLKYGRRPAPEVLEELGAEVLPRLNSHERRAS